MTSEQQSTDFSSMANEFHKQHFGERACEKLFFQQIMHNSDCFNDTCNETFE